MSSAVILANGTCEGGSNMPEGLSGSKVYFYIERLDFVVPGAKMDFLVKISTFVLNFHKMCERLQILTIIQLAIGR